uniref:Uncharacterized protein n=1 Tax=Ananas comosus var. bracteatus TaxID=296719 RepID=A0A6V7PM13_ANACO|nr:unnamed protein product [Ananas comosus var. bracteatus]
MIVPADLCAEHVEMFNQFYQDEAEENKPFNVVSVSTILSSDMLCFSSSSGGCSGGGCSRREWAALPYDWFAAMQAPHAPYRRQVGFCRPGFQNKNPPGGVTMVHMRAKKSKGGHPKAEQNLCDKCQAKIEAAESPI